MINIKICLKIKKFYFIVLKYKFYKQLLFYIYEFTINDREIIINNTELNIRDGKHYDKGFDYIASLNISIQGADAKKTLKEIINMLNLNKNKYDIHIKLKDKSIIQFNL